jgi:hypothetical protein
VKTATSNRPRMHLKVCDGTRPTRWRNWLKRCRTAWVEVTDRKPGRPYHRRIDKNEAADLIRSRGPRVLVVFYPFWGNLSIEFATD